MKKKKIGIIGCGTIGSGLACFIAAELSHCAELAWLCDFHPEKSEAVRKSVARGRKSPAVVSLPALIRKSDLVIESASASVAGMVARRGLEAGKQVLIMSAGGLEDFLKTKIPSRGTGKLWVPSGAVGGIDAVLAAQESGIRKIRLITRKPPAGLQGAPYFQKHPFPVLSGREEKCVFRGMARAAVRAFPKNVNVAAVVALAGAGFEKTKVEVWTSRSYRKNVHEVHIEAGSGSMQYITANVPSPENPKTSAQAIYSARALLRKILSPVRVGT